MSSEYFSSSAHCEVTTDYVRLQVLTAVCINIIAFWDIDEDRGFRDPYCLHHQCDYRHAKGTSKTSVYSYETRQHYILEDYHFQ
jgi:hypothetical protein